MPATHAAHSVSATDPCTAEPCTAAEVEPLATYEPRPHMDTGMEMAVEVVPMEEPTWPEQNASATKAAIPGRTAPTPAMMQPVWATVHLIGQCEVIDGDLQPSGRPGHDGIGRGRNQCSGHEDYRRRSGR